ncbi:hypothetical protein C8R43DRAFT_899682 [Mycena crocata]|nr:hypothetical protein C8R43DRAFT_899682 [Mycena crocata]
MSDPIIQAFDWSTFLAELRQKPLLELKALAAQVIPPQLPLPDAYIATLNDKSQTIAFLSTLLVYFYSQGRMIPRQYQLESTDAFSKGLDSLVDSGTGSGKTLCQILPNLLWPTTTSMTVSPLKRLQIFQVCTICISSSLSRWQL